MCERKFISGRFFAPPGNCVKNVRSKLSMNDNVSYCTVMYNCTCIGSAAAQSIAPSVHEYTHALSAV